MGNQQQFVQAVDAFMPLRKVLVGAESPNWQRGRDAREARLKLPLEIEGEQRGQHLVVMAYPEYRPAPKFRIGISCFEKIVCRLDFEKDASHLNHGRGGRMGTLIHGPHWHSWEINRPETWSLLDYDKLSFAEPFDAAQRFDATLRWYCQKRNIALGAHGIEFPQSEILI